MFEETLESISKEVPFLAKKFVGNPYINWIVALCVAILVYVILSSIIKGLARVIEKRAEKTGIGIDDMFAAFVHSIGRFLFIAASLYLGSQFLELTKASYAILNNLIVCALLIQAGLWASKLAQNFVPRLLKPDENEMGANAAAIGLISFLVRVIVWALIVILVLDNAGIDITALVAGLGVGGIAVALAVQNILGDLLSSLSIVLDKPFQVGDFIIVGDFMGTVEHVGLKTTRLRSLSGEQLVFSNSDLLGSRVRNFKRMNDRRIVFNVGVTYQTSSEQLQKIPEIIKVAIERQEQARFDRSHFKNFGDSSLVFESVYYVQLPDYAVYMDVQQAINLEIFEEFKENSIEFAYPTQTIFLEQGNS